MDSNGPWLAKVQILLGFGAFLLEMVALCLDALHRGIPLPADLDEQLEGRAPMSVAAEIAGAIECVVNDCLTPAVRTLREASSFILSHDEQATEPPPEAAPEAPS